MADVRNDPSMEEILASIKRIIADDSAAVLSAPRTRSARAVATQADAAVPIPASMITPIRKSGGSSTDEVLELTDAVPNELAAPESAEPAAENTAHAISAGPELISSVTAEASRHAFAALSSAVANPAPAPAPEQTLEGMVREMLRPMLKEWLDARLPELVEGVVQREIARIAGRTL